MRKLCVVVGMLLLVSFSAAAQDTPQGELFGGYSFQRFNPGGGFTGGNLNGWMASLTGNVNSWFGVTAEFAGNYGKDRFGAATTIETNHHTFMFGPRFSYRANEHWTPFVHALFGFGRLTGAHLGTTFGDTLVDTGFAWASGGGIDIKASPRLAVRIVQVDVLYTRFERPLGTQAAQTSVRLSFGINYRFGSR